jgi:hypothetical protein
MRITYTGMKRIGTVLLSVALAVQFAAGARVFDSHEAWTQTCTGESHHFCNDINPHDSDHCAICLLTATGPAPLAVESLSVVQVDLPLTPKPHSTPILTLGWDATGSRGPPLLCA